MKFPKKILCLFLSLCLLIPLAACGSQLETPTGFNIDLENNLTWESVSGARSYRIEIKAVGGDDPTEDTTRHTEYSLDDLEEGDYEIRLRSVGGKKNDILSAWSDVIDFHRDHDSGLRFKLINNGSEYEVSRVGSAEGIVTIDDEYRGKPVTAIGETAFRESKKLEGIVIGKNIRSIGQAAFHNCIALKSVVIPDTVTSIGISAFQGCAALESVTLPSELEAIPERAFAYCSALTEIDLPATLKSIGVSAFSNCTNITGLTIPDSVTSIGAYAFSANNALEEATIGSGVTYIGEYAFANNKALTKVNLPAEVPTLTLDQCAFGGCTALTDIVLPRGTASIGAGSFLLDESLDEMEIPESVTEIGIVAFDGTGILNAQETSSMRYVDDWMVAVSQDFFETAEKVAETDWKEGVVGIGAQAFAGRVGDEPMSGSLKLEEVNFPRSLKYIGDHAFTSSHMLKRVFARGGGLQTIGSYAFADCEVLTNVQFSNGLQTIGSYAFYNDEILDNNRNNPHLLVPETVTKIGTYAFRGTRLWTSAANDTETPGVAYAGNWVVGLTSNVSVLELKQGTEGISDYGFYYHDGLHINGGTIYEDSKLSNVIGLQSVRNIGVGAFYNCVALGAVSLHQSITEIKPYTFYNCATLFHINLPTRLESIGDLAFYACTYLQAVDCSATRVETIGARAFYGCAELQTLDLGTRLKEIGFRAFFGCTALSSLVIPDSVTAIGADSFARTGLQSLHLGSGVVTIGDNAFRESKLSEIVIPDNVKAIGDCAFYGLGAITATVRLGNGVETIGDYAFCASGVTGNIVIPASVRSVGRYAFAANNFLSSVVFVGSPVVEQHAFYSCPLLTIYVKAGMGQNFEGGWNSSFRPVVYGCEVDENGRIVSVAAGNVEYGTALGGIVGPYVDGFDCLGWAESVGGEVVCPPDGIADLPDGKTVYPVYTEHVEPELEPDPELS